MTTNGGGRTPPLPAMISGSINVLAVAFAVAALIVVPVPVAAAAAPTRLDTYLVRMVNRMERKMEFDCDEWPDDFELSANGGDMNVTYETAIDRPGDDIMTPRVSCIWSYEGNYMSNMMIWDEEKWPEKKACLVGGGRRCELVFENKEEVLVVTSPAPAPGSRRVLGDLAVKECSTHWYGHLLPWGAGCTYPNHDHAYAGTVHSTWTTAAMDGMIGGH
uniref:DUF7771 domain-containing protein n=1 Tax=Oryza punctata TaxID=4537 RepID=A0A0E0LU13_ORYPU